MNLIFAAVFAFAAQAANERFTPGGIPCHEEVALLCGGIQEQKEIAECLLRQEAKISAQCRSYLEKMKSSWKPGNSLEDDLVSGRSGRGMPGMGGGKPALSYSGWFTPFASPAAIQFHQARVGFPISKNERDTISLSVGGNSTAFDRAVAIPGGPVLPAQFYSAEMGAQYFHRGNDGHAFAATAQLGKASDKPIKDKTVVGASLSYSLPDRPHSRWIFSLFYSNNSAFLNGMPVPGVAYMYLTEDFVGIFGFPFASIRWKPAHPWVISASVFGNNFSAEAAFGDRHKLQSFVGILSQHYSYMRYDRLNADDRVVLADRRAGGGLRFPLLGALEAEFEGGYAFGRSAYETDKASFRVGSDVPRAYFDNTWFAAWNFRLPLQ